MDSIRAALGVDKINYYGFSYGTYLGQVYATQYPTRVGRFVLDGVVNPRRAWYAANLDQDRAFDRNMNVYWHYLARHPRAFHLGKHWRAISAATTRELRQLDRNPLLGGRLGPDELADVMLDAGYYVYNWVDLGQAYSDLVRHAPRRRPARALPRRQRGRRQRLRDVQRRAVHRRRRGPAGPARAPTRWAVHRQAPFLTWGNTWYNAPCLSWHAPTHRRLGVSGSAADPEDPADQRDPRRGHAVHRGARRTPPVPDAPR